MIGTNELLVIFGVALVLFGASKIPDIARALGRASVEFEKAKKEGEIEIKKMEEEIEHEKERLSLYDR